jgi:hypothetical protein
MTDAEWLSDELSVDERIYALEELGRADGRKLRLYACAWARRLWDALGHRTHGRVVELAEDFADGLVGFEELAGAGATALEFRERYQTVYDQEDICPGRVVLATAEEDAASAARDAYYHASTVFNHLRDLPFPDPPRGEGPRLLREIFGNPSRPSSVDPAWLTYNGGIVAALARGAYTGRILPQGTLDPARLGVLADALEEAGCSDGEILTHLRAPGRHVRGCWAVDLILEQAGGFGARGRESRALAPGERPTLHTVEDILAAASRLAASEIARLQEGLRRLEQGRNESRPPEGGKKK